MVDAQYLTNQFLIAMPGLEDPNFFHSVTYICEHNADGALGLVVNRPLEMRLGEILQHIQLDHAEPEARQMPVHLGGPVQQDRGFVLHEPLGNWEATLKVTDRIGITSSIDILHAIARNEGPERSLITLGYAGWGAGQLEQEMADNAWLSGPANPEILFHTPDEERWRAAAASLGVDLDLLSGDAGHA
ncbi:MAG: YqgE/AlgH family protein [Thiogranum sp.]|jgi:putative transcriptional regulator|nr:YqgE/AlgH family protein [Thiogranum sp.]